jgi:hypothetical protein
MGFFLSTFMFYPLPFILYCVTFTLQSLRLFFFLFPVPQYGPRVFPVPCSLFPVPYSLFPLMVSPASPQKSFV